MQYWVCRRCRRRRPRGVQSVGHVVLAILPPGRLGGPKRPEHGCGHRLRVDRRNVRLDGRPRDVQPFTDLFEGEMGRELVEDLLFGRCQHRKAARRAGGVGESIRQLVRVRDDLECHAGAVRESARRGPISDRPACFGTPNGEFGLEPHHRRCQIQMLFDLAERPSGPTDITTSRCDARFGRPERQRMHRLRKVAPIHDGGSLLDALRCGSELGEIEMGKREMTVEHELLVATDRELCTDAQPFFENRDRFSGLPKPDERLSHRPTAARHPR